MKNLILDFQVIQIPRACGGRIRIIIPYPGYKDTISADLYLTCSFSDITDKCME